MDRNENPRSGRGQDTLVLADNRDNTSIPSVTQDLPVTCLKFKSYQKNTLQGFADLETYGITICDCTLHLKEGKRWVSFPARPFKGQDGKDSWVPLVKIHDREYYFRFQRAALAAIDRFALAPDTETGGSRVLPF